MPIKKLPLELRPREKAFVYGLQKLSDVELIALFIRTGTKNKDAIDLAKELIKSIGSLQMLFHSEIESLIKIIGIGKVKALELQAVGEIALRITSEIKRFIKTESDAIAFSLPLIGKSNNEKFLIAVLNNQFEIIYSEIMFSGLEDQVQIDPKDVIATVLKKGGKKLLCFHNHPSGNVNPSLPDKIVTKRIENMAQIFGILFIGHYILNSKGQFSLL